MSCKLKITIGLCTLLLHSMLATSAQKIKNAVTTQGKILQSEAKRTVFTANEDKIIRNVDTLVDLINNIDIDTLELIANAPGTSGIPDNQIINYTLKKKIDSLTKYTIQLANSYCQLGEYNKAYACYQDLYKRNNNNVAVIAGLTIINEKIGQTKNNIVFYKRLIKLDSLNSTSYYYKLAPLLENHLLLQDALEAYHIIFNNNKDWETAVRICDLSLKLRLQYQADSIINIAMNYNPDICTLKYKKGGIAYLLGKYDSSIQYIQTAFSCGDNIPAYLKTIGLSCFYAGKYDSALNYLVAP